MHVHLFYRSVSDLIMMLTTFTAAWDDGTIRAFSPEKAELLYTIHNAHSKVNHGMPTTIQ